MKGKHDQFGQHWRRLSECVKSLRHRGCLDVMPIMASIVHPQLCQETDDKRKFALPVVVCLKEG